MHFVRRPALVLSVVALATLGGCASRADVPPVAATEAEPPPPTAEARGWYLRAQVAEGRGDLQEAERALQWLTRKDGRRAVTHDHLARFYMRHRRWDDARGAWLHKLVVNECTSLTHLDVRDTGLTGSVDEALFEVLVSRLDSFDFRGNACQHRWMFGRMEIMLEILSRERVQGACVYYSRAYAASADPL